MGRGSDFYDSTIFAASFAERISFVKKAIIDKRSRKQEVLMRAEIRFNRRKKEVMIRLVRCDGAFRTIFVTLRRAFFLAAVIAAKRILGL